MSTIPRPTQRPRVRARRTLLGLLLLTFALGAAQVAGAVGAQAASTISVNQCNGQGPGASGATTSMQCTVVVVNTINGAHRGSVTTLTRLCTLGPCAPGNGTFVTRSTSIVTSINQCNGSDNDSAHPIVCKVTVTNNISAGTTAASPVKHATVNQCVGSATGGGGAIVCAPYPATTTGATVTQCNGSGTGGGGTVHCTLDPASVVSPAIPVRVNQCNGTGNPGGSTVTCSVRILTHITPGPTSGSGSTGGTTKAAGSATGSSGGKASGTTTGAKGSAGSSVAGFGQVSRVPVGGVQTGGGSTSGVEHGWLFALGGVLLLASAAVGVGTLRLRQVTGRPE